MDPDATWKMLCEALKALEKNPDNEELRTCAITLLEAFARWLRIGGFPPAKTQLSPEQGA